MSSLIRRIERQQTPSQPVHWNAKTKKRETNPARQKFYMGRGSKLGVNNPRDKALIARLRRENRHAN